MRKLFLLIPLVFVIGLGSFFAIQLGKKDGSTEEVLPSPLIGKPVPAFSLPSLQDPERMITQDDLKGSPALLNVWATWCPTCKQEHAQLNRIAQNHGVTIYGINYKDDRAKAKQWLNRYLDPYALNVYDPKGMLGLDLGVYGAPETYVLDAQGIIRYKHVGAVDEVVWQQLKEVLDEIQAEGDSA